jgi:hypothetical protein
VKKKVSSWVQLYGYILKNGFKADLIELLQGLLMSSIKLAEDLPVMKSSEVRPAASFYYGGL